jgi:hypothetical protein
MKCGLIYFAEAQQRMILMNLGNAEKDIKEFFALIAEMATVKHVSINFK